MIDFANMKVGDKAKLPALKWGTENRQVYEQAGKYCREVAAKGEGQPQFQVDGHDDGNGYWIERVR